MKVEIEDYRGWTIFFDTDAEMFYSVSQDHDVDKKNRTYSAAKSAIDEYLKENQVFKPFKVQRIGYDGFVQHDVTIVGITKGGNYMGQNSEGRFQISKYDRERYVFPNAANDAVYAEAKKLTEEITALERSRNKVLEKLKIRTLKDYQNGREV